MEYTMSQIRDEFIQRVAQCAKIVLDRDRDIIKFTEEPIKIALWTNNSIIGEIICGEYDEQPQLNVVISLMLKDDQVYNVDDEEFLHTKEWKALHLCSMSFEYQNVCKFINELLKRFKYLRPDKLEQEFRKNPRCRTWLVARQVELKSIHWDNSLALYALHISTKHTREKAIKDFEGEGEDQIENMKRLADAGNPFVSPTKEFKEGEKIDYKQVALDMYNHVKNLKGCFDIQDKMLFKELFLLINGDGTIKEEWDESDLSFRYNKYCIIPRKVLEEQKLRNKSQVD